MPNPRDGNGQQRSRRSEGGGQSQSRRGGGASSSGAGGSSGPARPQNTTGLRITYLQNPQVEIIKHDKTVGSGVQKTLAYDTPFTV